MSKHVLSEAERYDGCYIKLSDEPVYYAVDDGQKIRVANAEQMYKIGLRPVHVVTPQVLARIPFVGEESDEEE